MLAMLGRGRFARNILVLAGGAAGAQLVNVVVSPVITRLYAPNEIGQLGLFLSFVSVAAIVVPLRYEQAIVVPELTSEAARLARLAGAIAVPLTVVMAVPLYLLITNHVAGFGSLPLLVVPLATLALGASALFAILRYWLIRHHAYRVIAEVQLAQSAVRAAGQTILGAIGLGVVGLLASDLLGRVAGLWRMLRATRPAYRESIQAPGRDGNALARAYWRFPVLGLPSSLVNALALALPVPILAATYGLEIAGYYDLVQRVPGLPLNVIGASVGDALLARIAEQSRVAPELAPAIFRKTGLMLAAIAIPGAVAVALLAQAAFDIGFGREWGDAGRMAGRLSPWFAAALIVSPLSRVVLIFEGQGSKLVYDAAALAAAVVGIVGPWQLGLDWPDTILVFAILQVVAYSIYLLVLERLVRRAA